MKKFISTLLVAAAILIGGLFTSTYLLTHSSPAIDTDSPSSIPTFSNSDSATTLPTSTVTIQGKKVKLHAYVFGVKYCEHTNTMISALKTLNIPYVFIDVSAKEKEAVAEMIYDTLFSQAGDTRYAVPITIIVDETRKIVLAAFVGNYDIVNNWEKITNTNPSAYYGRLIFTISSKQSQKILQILEQINE